ncbi:glutathione S-transferase C-terminal domain-containing protein [Jeotgalibaca sp. A127]|uniref:glutathione S-transferase C-terminal domain-containing protein n=1 Tax=Jeotgalibaca sp. A127 TaxID=3457324 RepID=UPI003FD4B2AA
MEKHVTFAQETQDDGSFTQQAIAFDTPFGEQEGQLKPEPNRYRLVWMPACPHAHKVVIVRHLLGLRDVISLGTTGPYRTDEGWVFSDDKNGKDSVTGARSTLELYRRTDPDYSQRPTVPLMVDEETGKVVNNDHKNLTIQLETAWADFHGEQAPDLYPEKIRDEIDQLNQIIYEEINVGFYKVGFAQSQEAYEKAYDRLFNYLDYFEERLSNQRYLFGSQITDSDVRIYPSLVRFDVVYYDEFRARKKRLRDYSNLWAYTRDLYQLDGFHNTTDFEFIKESYYRSPHLGKLFGNENNILPKGPSLVEWSQPHNRERLDKVE